MMDKALGSKFAPQRLQSIVLGQQICSSKTAVNSDVGKNDGQGFGKRIRSSKTVVNSDGQGFGQRICSSKTAANGDVGKSYGQGFGQLKDCSQQQIL